MKMKNVLMVVLAFGLSTSLFAQVHKKTVVKKTVVSKSTGLAKTASAKKNNSSVISMSAEKIKSYNQKLTSVFPGGEHLTFKGVSFGETVKNFKEKMLFKGFSYPRVWGSAVDKRWIEGPFWNEEIRTLYVRERIKNGPVSSIEPNISFSNKDRAKAEKQFVDILNYIQNLYPNTVVDFRDIIGSSGARSESFSFRILSGSDKKILGSIYLDFISTTDKRYYNNIQIYDYVSCMQSNGVNCGLYDLSYLVKPKYNSCILKIDDRFLTIKLNKNGKETTAVLNGDCYNNILKILFKDEMSDYGKQELFLNYLDKLNVEKNPSFFFAYSIGDGEGSYDISSYSISTIYPTDESSLMGFGRSMFNKYFGDKPERLAKGIYGFYDTF